MEQQLPSSSSEAQSSDSEIPNDEPQIESVQNPDEDLEALSNLEQALVTSEEDAPNREQELVLALQSDSEDERAQAMAALQSFSVSEINMFFERISPRFSAAAVVDILVEMARSSHLQQSALATLKNISFYGNDCNSVLVNRGALEVASNLIRSSEDEIVLACLLICQNLLPYVTPIHHGLLQELNVQLIHTYMSNESREIRCMVCLTIGHLSTIIPMDPLMDQLIRDCFNFEGSGPDLDVISQYALSPFDVGKCLQSSQQAVQLMAVYFMAHCALSSMFNWEGVRNSALPLLRSLTRGSYSRQMRSWAAIVISKLNSLTGYSEDESLMAFPAEVQALFDYFVTMGFPSEAVSGSIHNILEIGEPRLLNEDFLFQQLQESGSQFEIPPISPVSPVEQTSLWNIPQGSVLDVDTVLERLESKIHFSVIHRVHACSSSSLMSNEITFLEKREIFRKALRRSTNSTKMEVNRDNLVNDMLERIMFYTDEDVKSPISFRFENERGIDQGGLRSEALTLFASEVAKSKTFFEIPDQTLGALFPNREARLKNFEFKGIGRLIGQALLSDIHVDFPLSISICKLLIGKTLTFRDLNSIYGAQFINSIVRGIIAAAASNKMEMMGLTMADGNHDLVANGRNIDVTNENAGEYVERLCQWRLGNCVRRFLEQFVEGFHEVVGLEHLRKFDEQEMLLLICGSGDVDVQDLCDHCEVTPTSAKNHQVLEWLWETLKKMSGVERCKFLQFTTGRTRLPPGGAGQLNPRFKISLIEASDKNLPRAHTCTNLIDLPMYPSQEVLESKLVYAINNTEGFGFA